jgi:hypothetical protein
MISLLCPYCKNNSPSKTIFASEIPITNIKGSKYGKLIDGINRATSERYRRYKCFRCKGVFTTRERPHEIDYNFTPKAEDLEIYAKRLKEGKEPKLLYRTQVNEKVQELILKVFGEDIKKDIELDLKELERRKKVK